MRRMVGAKPLRNQHFDRLAEYLPAAVAEQGFELFIDQRDVAEGEGEDGVVQNMLDSPGHVQRVGLGSSRIAEVQIVAADIVAVAGKTVRGYKRFPGLIDRENRPLRVQHGDIGRQHVDDAGIEAMVLSPSGETLMGRHESPPL